ncbi:metallopeptidase TldD-related protein [Streptomyces sp. NPDC014623]|uniref:metallopeptidase TldD-related protein n=1 Tax=Streptomyces sp. NPDC014623 TaxID=3364875 RepID=UPI0036F4E45F
MTDVLSEALDAARVELGPRARIVPDERDGLWRVRISLGAPHHGSTPQWGTAAYDRPFVAGQIRQGVRQLLDDQALLRLRSPLAEPVTGPALLSPTAAGVLAHECFGHTSEADNYLTDGGALGRVLGDRWTPAALTVRDRPGARPYAGSYARDDEGTTARTVTLLREGYWTGLLTDRSTRALSDGRSTGHGRGRRGTVVPRCSVLEVAAGRDTAEGLRSRLGEGWLLGTAIGGFSVRGHLILELLWARRVRAGRATREVVGPVAVCARKAALAGRITAVGDDVTVHSSPYTCVKAGHEVGSTLISPSLLLDRCVLRPLADVERLLTRSGAPSVPPPNGTGDESAGAERRCPPRQE